MKSLLTTFGIGLLLLTIAGPIRLAAQEPEHPKAQIRYSVKVLGSLGGTSCCLVIEINDRGWVDFTSNLSGDQNFHPVLWRNGQLIDLGTLGGPNASVGGMNDHGDVTVGGSDTGIPDPLGEDACSFGTHQTCLSYVWHQGKRTPVPTLGGNNNDVNAINNRGDVLAFAETPDADPTCVTPQVLGYEAFIWQPRTGEIRVLHPLAGDSVSVAFDINDRGQAVGYSGGCGSGLGDFSAAYHAVMWQDGKPTDLGNFGGTIYNVPLGINNRGDVVGILQLPVIGLVGHAFLWTKGHLTDLGTLPGDVTSWGNRINDDGVVAVQSCDANGNCRAAIWRDGVMTDLNTLIPANSQLFLEVANSINSRGEIVGYALDQETGATVPFLATPCDRQESDSDACAQPADDTSTSRQPRALSLPDSLRQQLRRQRGFGLGAVRAR